MFSSCGGICAWSGNMFPRFAFGPFFSVGGVNGFDAVPVLVLVLVLVLVSVFVLVLVSVSLLMLASV